MPDFLPRYARVQSRPLAVDEVCVRIVKHELTDPMVVDGCTVPYRYICTAVNWHYFASWNLLEGPIIEDKIVDNFCYFHTNFGVALAY